MASAFRRIVACATYVVSAFRRTLASFVVSAFKRIVAMKHVIYEDPVTHQFALVRLPKKYANGDAIPIDPHLHWYATHADAVAALAALFDLEE